MVYKTQVEVVQNDYGYNLDMKLEDYDGAAVDLTAVGTLNFYAGITGLGTKVAGTCSIIGGTAMGSLGSVRYVVGSLDFNQANKVYQCEVQANWGTKVITARGLTVMVRGDLPES